MKESRYMGTPPLLVMSNMDTGEPLTSTACTRGGGQVPDALV